MAALALLVLSLSLVAAGPARARTTVPAKFQRWLGRETVGVLVAADRVEPFAVRPWPAGHRLAPAADAIAPVLPPGTPLTIHGYGVWAVGSVQARGFAQRLSGLLLDERSYRSDGPPFNAKVIKGCIPAPGVVFRVWAGRRSVDVLLCFQCDQVFIGKSRSDPGRPASGDIDPSRAAFVTLAQEALEEVAAIRAVPAVRPSGRAAPLDRAGLLKDLQRGGYVIVMAAAGSPREAPTAQRAAAMGTALREGKIPIATVLSSPALRAIETTRYAQLPSPKLEEALGEGDPRVPGGTETRAAWLRTITTTVPRGGNLLVVTQTANMAAAFPRLKPAAVDGEALIIRPGAKGPDLVGRLGILEWGPAAAPRRVSSPTPDGGTIR